MNLKSFSLAFLFAAVAPVIANDSVETPVVATDSVEAPVVAQPVTEVTETTPANDTNENDATVDVQVAATNEKIEITVATTTTTNN